jgi:hypothetical protein
MPGRTLSAASVSTEEANQARLTLAEFALITAQLGLLAIVIRQFQIESPAFLRIVLLAFAGFAVHAWLPLRYRLPFFVALSLTGIAVVFGPTAGAWLVGIGLVLIAACHLPLPMRGRVAVLLGAGALLALLRADWIHPPWPAAIWPILGSMFMFRLIVYLYDLAHDRAPTSLTRTLAYFFLLPSVCFPMFPVIDYKTFRRTYYDIRPYRGYQVGVDWMARGVVHLVLYRLVYYHFTVAPSEVAGPASLGQFLLSTFLLYLRISGQFHLIIGMLHLFGFNLPETHHRYYLASSFTDFWRRINIYWKDFMLKVFYYPIYFRLRAWGPTWALTVSTLLVFLATWLLHSYQWFWLRGSFPILWQDAMFWGVLGILVVGNALYEDRFGRRRTLGRQTWDIRSLAGVTVRTAGTFAVICVLWSLWTAESVVGWLSMWAALGPALADARPTPLVLAGTAVAIGSVISSGASTRSTVRGRAPRLPTWAGTATTIASMLVLAVVALHPVYSKFNPQAANLIQSLRSAGLSRVDTALLERGYYEDLTRVDRFNSQLWELYMRKPVQWLDGFENSGLVRFTGDFLQTELVPSFASLTRYGTIRTNRWGMRDQDYEKQPSPGTYRIALLGASTVMGWGVGDDQTFEAIVEERLNRERVGQPHDRYEILNFAVPGYHPLQQLAVLDKALAFGPGAVIYVATAREPDGAADYLAKAIGGRLPVPYDFLQETARRAQIDASTDDTTARRRLEPFRWEVLTWLYGEIAQRCRDRGSRPVWVFVPQVVDLGPWRQEIAEARRIAEGAGFATVDLGDVFDGRDPRAVSLAEWDNHPNAQGHRYVADRLYPALLESDILSPIRTTATR